MCAEPPYSATAGDETTQRRQSDKEQTNTESTRVMSAPSLLLSSLIIAALAATTEQRVGAPCRNNSDCSRRECCMGTTASLRRETTPFPQVFVNPRRRRSTDFGFTRGTCQLRGDVSSNCYMEWGSVKMFTGDSSPIYPLCPCYTSWCLSVKSWGTDMYGSRGSCSSF